MLYRYVQVFVWIALRIFYRYRATSNFQILERKKPTILVSNHVNAFIDPIVVGCHMRKGIYYLARGDVFKPGLATRILNGFNVIPIFRMEEGGAADERMEKNNLTFERCFELLKKNNTIKLYPEAICVQEKRLRKLRKGAARIALGAGEKHHYNLDLQIIPIGLNYSDPKKFGSSIYINVGQPIDTAPYFDLHKSDKVKAVNKLTALMEKKIKELLVHVENKENDVAYEQLSEMLSKQLAGIRYHQPKAEYAVNLRIASYINNIDVTDNAHWKETKHTLKDYFSLLHQHKLRDHLVVKPATIFVLLLKSIFTLALLPIHVIGLIFNYIPFILSHIIAKKVVRTIEFRASIAVGSSIFIWKLFYAQLMILVWFITGSGQAALYLLALMISTGVFSYLYYPLLKKTMGSCRFIFIRIRLPHVYQRIKQLREQIVTDVTPFLFK